MDNELPWSLLFLVSFLLLVTGLELKTTYTDIKQLKGEAIRRGYAEWKVDEDGGTTFTWKSNESEY